MQMNHASFTTVRAPRRLDEMAFCAWIGAAMPGDRLEYHRGFLVLDTFPALARRSEPERRALAALARRALWAAEQGLVHLVQERLGPDRFAYIAIARPKPKAAEASLSALLLEGEPA